MKNLMRNTFSVNSHDCGCPTSVHQDWCVGTDINQVAFSGCLLGWLRKKLLTSLQKSNYNLRVQLNWLECQPSKLNVVGSSPTTRSKFCRSMTQNWLCTSFTRRDMQVRVLLDRPMKKYGISGGIWQTRQVVVLVRRNPCASSSLVYYPKFLFMCSYSLVQSPSLSRRWASVRYRLGAPFFCLES